MGVADNYLSLKAYAATGKDAITDYMKKSKRSGLSSIGDLLVTVGRLSDVKVSKSEGVGAGAKSLPAIFGAKNVKAKNAVSSINFLVNGSRQVPARQGRDQHAEVWHSRSGPSPRQVQELRVCQCPTSWFVLQAVRLCWSCCQDDLLPSLPYWHGRQGRQEGQGTQGGVREAP